jgi:Txe/YoeB family toxin of Txe-Axe toxin-antitoxin module
MEFQMKLLKLTNPKAQNQSQYLKKRKKKLFFNFLKIIEFQNKTFETYQSMEKIKANT